MAELPQYINPSQDIYSRMGQNEGFSNGVWNSIICHYLRQGRYIVMPEYFLSTGEKADLTVIERDNINEVVLIFEGKDHQGKAAAWDKLEKQAVDYMTKPQTKCKIALIAKGNKCRFITNEGTDTRQLRCDDPVKGWVKKDKGITKDLDIIEHAAEIHTGFNFLVWKMKIP